jgi:hypothetical protein
VRTVSFLCVALGVWGFPSCTSRFTRPTCRVDLSLYYPRHAYVALTVVIHRRCIVQAASLHFTVARALPLCEPCWSMPSFFGRMSFFSNYPRHSYLITNPPDDQQRLSVVTIGLPSDQSTRVGQSAPCVHRHVLTSVDFSSVVHFFFLFHFLVRLLQRLLCCQYAYIPTLFCALLFARCLGPHSC